MLVRDIMTTNVVTIPSNTPIMEARKIMEFHRFERLPVVDRGKLVGIVTKDTLLKAGPSQVTTLTVWELNYLLAKMTVKEIMKKNVVTIAPDCTVEFAIATGQSNRVGSLVVVEDDKVIGILTTNDFFYKLLNPLMGIGEEGTRIIVYRANEAEQVQKVMGCINKNGARIKAMCTVKSSGDEKKNDLIVHLDIEDASQIIAQLKSLGFSVDERSHRI
ncbi:MAG TPA: acetoin dehydrogenase [Deltaproteobacteria bacterium]|nr:acetoin dehydrogenase [Deltaproteobacteria bacterium]